MAEPVRKTPEERARKRVEEFEGLMWHIAAYVIVNAFLWFIDLNAGGGLDWAYWTTIPWGMGLLFHIAAYFIDLSGVWERRYEKILAEERAREGGEPPAA
jgi:hypothetical protein